MKMRKSTWLLLVLALAAILLVAGCAPTTPGNGDEEPGNGEPTADKACPKVVKTEVSKLYVADPTDLTKPNFQIKITFDENINSSCIENLAKWAITVANTDRVGTPTVTKLDVDVDGKIVTVKARVVEVGEEGEPGVGYDFVLFTEDFEDLDEAIAVANDLIEAVGIVNGRVLFGESWLDFLAALDAAESIPDLFANVRDLVDDVELFYDGLDDPATITAAEAAEANALAARATALAERADALGQDDLATALTTLATALGDGEAEAEDDLSGGVDVTDVSAAANAVALADALDEALTALNDAFAELGVIAVATPVPGTPAPRFAGLICNKDDAEAYEKEFGLAAGTVKFADEVSWKLTDCAVYDDLGNVCCDFEGKDCCVEPYCEECPPDGCDLTEPGACL